jgi:hypothetical protein
MLRYATPNGHQPVPLRNSHMDRTSLDQGCQRWGLRLMVSHVFRPCIMRVSVYRATLVRSIPVQALPHLGSNKQITVLDLRPRPTQPTAHVQNKALLWVLSSLSPRMLRLHPCGTGPHDSTLPYGPSEGPQREIGRK